MVVRIAPALVVLAACSGGGETGSSDADPTVPGTDVVTWPVPDCVDDTFEPILQEFDFAVEEIDGLPVMWYVPPGAQGVVFPFHGTGGDVGKMNTLHYSRLWSTFVAAGFGVVITESVDRMRGVWNDSREPSENVDFLHLREVRGELVARGELTRETPVFGWGFSEGAGFVAPFTELVATVDWPIRGGMVHSGSLRFPIPMPAFVTGPENDNLTGTALSGHERQVEAGYPSTWTLTLERPFARDEMLIHPSYDAEEALDVFEELRDLGWIDDDGVRLVDVAQVDSLMNTYESNSVLPGASRVTVQLRVTWATHRPTSEVACEERDFMLEAL